MKKITLFLSFLFLISCTKDPIIYTLTTSANPSDGGTVSPSTQQYDEGKTATITATPAAEYIFQSWSGATGSTNSTSVVMNSDKSVTANFVKKKYALTTTVEGEGTVSEKVIKAGAATDYNSGTIVELTAIPSGEWLFVEWKGDVTGTENPKQITIDKAKSVTAVFVKKQYALTIEIEGEGTVAEKVIKAGVATDYNSGTIVELTATPSTGWRFKEWAGDLTGTDNPKRITIDKAKTVKAVFDNPPPFYFDENGVTIKAGDWVTAGTTVELGGVTYTAVDRITLLSMVDNEEDVTKVVTTLIKDMAGIFSRNNNFNQDISSWDVSNVTDMNNMFTGATSFNQQIGNWDVSNVTNMMAMFYDANAFNKDIGDWDVSSVINMHAMFAGAEAFNQELIDWNISNVTRMSSMFRGASKFNQYIGDWNVSNVTDMSGMFYKGGLFNQDIGNWNVSNVTDMSGMFSGATSFNQDIGDWNVSKVTNMSMMLSGTSFNQDIGNWDVSKVTNMDSMFGEAFNNGGSSSIGDWDVSNVTNMNYLFYNSAFNQPIGNWDVGKVTNMYYMFGKSAFNQPIGSWNVKNVIKMSYMFVESPFNQDIGNWDVTNVYEMEFMFSSAKYSIKILETGM